MKRVPFLLLALGLVLACSDGATEPAIDLQPAFGLEPSELAQANTNANVERTVQLSPMYDDAANMRWSDIAGHPYDAAVQDPANGYDYAQASVTVTYNKHGTSFQGHLSARGLKPNFAYQLKLTGKPEDDPWANDQLGTLGRWWVEPGHLALGYLVFDYVVTDSEGDVEHDTDLVSSYHVLFRLDQRSPGDNDSAPTSHSVQADASSKWYDNTYDPVVVEIFAQNEHPEYPPGSVVLPAGLYNVSFVLTEESFHEDGSWATVMGSDRIRFGIDESQPEPVDPLTKADRNENGLVCRIESVKGNGDASVRYVDDKNGVCPKGELLEIP